MKVITIRKTATLTEQEWVEFDEEGYTRLGVVHSEEEIDRLYAQVEGARTKLSNDGFLSGAPPDVVDREREKQRSFEEQLNKLRGKRSSLAAG